MIATVLAAAALAATTAPAHPCRAALPRGPAMPAPLVLWTSCGGFQVARDGEVSRLPRHWLARHGSGTGRRYGAHLDIRRTRPGRFLLLRKGRIVWRSSGLYPGGGSVAFGPQSFAFASYRHGIYRTDLRGAERLVARGRGLYPYSFTSSGDLIVTGTHAITLVAPSAGPLRRYSYRTRNGYGFDERSSTLYYVTPAGRLATIGGTHAKLERSLRNVDGMLSVARPNRLVFSGARSITATTRRGTVIATAHWRSAHLNSDSGVAISADGNAFAFRLSDAHPGAHSSTATVYLLKAGGTGGQPIYEHHLGASGCAVGAGFSWHGSNLLYSSSDGTLVMFDTRAHTNINLTNFAIGLPHRSAAERALAAWRTDFRR